MRTLSFLAVLCIVSGNSVACARSDRPQPNRPSAKIEVTEEDKQNEKIALRNEAESKMMKGEYLHDGSLELAFVGDIESVPALLVVLKEYPPDKTGGMPCITEHALEALTKITGKNPGITHKAWSDWWEKYKKQKKVSSRLESDQ